MVSHNDMKHAEKTYSGFIGMVKWGAIAVVVLVALVVILIS